MIARSRGSTRALELAAHFGGQHVLGATMVVATLPVSDLEAKGVEFVDYTEGPLITTDHIAQLGPARGAWFRDPDGNFLGLRQG